MTPHTPPPLATLLLRFIVPPELTDGVLGDLAEEYAHALGDPVHNRKARARYWAQTVRSIGPMLVWHLRFGIWPRRALGVVLGIMTMAIVVGTSGAFVLRMVPEPYRAEIRHIGRGVPTTDTLLTGLAALMFMSWLFAGAAVAGRVYASYVRSKKVTAFLLLAGVLALLPLHGWVTEASGQERIWLQVTWVVTVLVGASVGFYANLRIRTT